MHKYSRENRRYLLALILLLCGLNLFLAVAFHLKMPALDRVRFLWFVASLAESVAAALMFAEAKHPDNDGNRFVQFQAAVWASIAMQTWSALIAQSVDPPTIIHYGLRFQCIYWTGIYTKSYAILLASLYQRGIINGRRKKQTVSS